MKNLFRHFLPGLLVTGVVVLTGVRADESLNRFMGLVSQRKLRYADDKPWTTASPEGVYYTMYPLYDLKARDILIYNVFPRASGDKTYRSYCR